MAKATTGYSFHLNCEQVEAAQMLARGCKPKDVLEVMFHITESSTPSEKGKATRELNKWMDLPGFWDCFESEVKRLLLPAYGRAINRVNDQIDSKNGWLANKAANDVITRYATLMGEDEKKVTVKIEGMPTLGTPDGDE